MLPLRVDQPRPFRPWTWPVDPAELTAALVDIPSVCGTEEPIADAVEAALRALDRVRGGAVRQRRAGPDDLGRPTRVLLAGHIDTVPIADNVPSRRDGDTLHGCGTTDMKSGDAMLLHLAATMREPSRDLTFVFYDCEEIDYDRNGLTRIQAELPHWLAADLAILGEPTNGLVEAGCQGTAAVDVTVRGRRAHSARSWMGDNAIHRAAGVLDRLAAFDARTVDIDGCVYREGLNAVGIIGRGGRQRHPRRVHRPGQLPVRAGPQPAERVGRAGGAVRRLRGAGAGRRGGRAARGCPRRPPRSSSPPPAERHWRSSAGPTSPGSPHCGIPAVNYGPGDPSLAHTREEHVSMTPDPGDDRGVARLPDRLTADAATARRALLWPV